ncbi:MAG TPA: hypothetical protein VFQ13_23210 [Anaerolineales bacterium]|nr:hypothetical protein [Anaerolineales bacterium]
MTKILAVGEAGLIGSHVVDPFQAKGRGVIANLSIEQVRNSIRKLC